MKWVWNTLKKSEWKFIIIKIQYIAILKKYIHLTLKLSNFETLFRNRKYNSNLLFFLSNNSNLLDTSYIHVCSCNRCHWWEGSKFQTFLGAASEIGNESQSWNCFLTLSFPSFPFHFRYSPLDLSHHIMYQINNTN